MSNFLKGLLLGIGLSFLLAPMRGQEMRRLLSEGFQQLFGSLPENGQLKQATQQVMDQVPQTLSALKNDTLETMSQGKNNASPLSKANQQTSSKGEQTEKDVATADRTITSGQQSTGEDASSGEGSSAGKQEVNDPLRNMLDVAPETRARLEAEGIYSTPQLLEHAQTKGDRAELAHKVGMSNRAFKEFVYRADLMQLKDVGEEVATLLEEAGVNGCKDLQQRNPQHLHTKLIEVQESRHIAPDTPGLDQVIEWIAQAKQITANIPEPQDR